MHKTLKDLGVSYVLDILPFRRIWLEPVKCASLQFCVTHGCILKTRNNPSSVRSASRQLYKILLCIQLSRVYQVNTQRGSKIL